VVARLVAVVAKWSPSGSQWSPSGRQVVASRELSFHKNKNYVRKVRYVWQIQDLAGRWLVGDFLAGNTPLGEI